MRQGLNRLETKLLSIIRDCGYAYDFTGMDSSKTVGQFSQDFRDRTQKRIIEPTEGIGILSQKL